MGLFTPVFRDVHSGLDHPRHILLPDMGRAALAGEIFLLCVIRLFRGGLSEPHHCVLIFRSSCLWPRGRGSIRVSRKSRLANLQLLQTPRHLIVMMRYASLSVHSKRLHFSVLDMAKSSKYSQISYVVTKQFEVYQKCFLTERTDHYCLSVTAI